MKEIISVSPSSREVWRKWLLENHLQEDSVWLVYHKSGSGIPSVSYNDAVEEALCFGWIDSKVQSVDEKSYRQYYCRRRAGSIWSKLNKDRVQRMIDAGRMTAAGLECIERAKKDGTWDVLEAAESLEVPEDMKTALQENPVALEYFERMSNSLKRSVIYYVISAKRAETRNKRICLLVNSFNNKKLPFNN